VRSMPVRSIMATVIQFHRGDYTGVRIDDYQVDRQLADSVGNAARHHLAEAVKVLRQTLRKAFVMANVPSKSRREIAARNARRQANDQGAQGVPRADGL
jgi:hypothetical protein